MLINFKRRRKDLTELLNEIEDFEEKMKTFSEKYPHYSYSLSLSKDTKRDEWVSDLKIERYEHTINTDT